MIPQNRPLDSLKTLFFKGDVLCPRPFPGALMRMWPISTQVNKPENDDPSIVEPIELATGPRRAGDRASILQTRGLSEHVEREPWFRHEHRPFGKAFR